MADAKGAVLRQQHGLGPGGAEVPEVAEERPGHPAARGQPEAPAGEAVALAERAGEQAHQSAPALERLAQFMHRLGIGKLAMIRESQES